VGCANEAERSAPAVPALAALPGVEVRVFRIRDEAVRSLVPEDSLRLGLERRLRAAGIPVLSADEAAQLPDRPQIWILFKVAASSEQGFACGWDLYVIQTVRRIRKPFEAIRAITWNSRSRIARTERLTLADAQSGLDSAATEFVPAYHAANSAE
jgi:hypothetical protein